MDQATALTAAACLVAARYSGPQVQEYLSQLAPADRRQVELALQVLAAKLGELATQTPEQPAVQVFEGRAVLYQQLREELARLDDAISYGRGRGMSADELAEVLEWRGILVRRQRALEAILTG